MNLTKKLERCYCFFVLVFFNFFYSSCSESTITEKQRQEITQTPQLEAITNITFMINEGQSSTNNQVVTLNLSAAKATKMLITQESDCEAQNQWIDYKEKIEDYKLQKENAKNTIFVKFTNDSGYKTECVSKEITHDNIAPLDPSLIINNNAIDTISQKVKLDLKAEGSSFMLIGDASICEKDTGWLSFSSEIKDWQISSSEENAKVYAKFKDEAGNITNCIFDEIKNCSQVTVNKLKFEARMGLEISKDLSSLISDTSCVTSYTVKDSTIGAQLNLEKAQLKYYLDKDFQEVTNDVFYFDVFANSGKIATRAIDVTVTPYDPLYKHQWSIRNTGQNSFANSGGEEDQDTKVDEVHKKNILGSNIVIAVIDDGLELSHEDLSVADGSWDFTGDGDSDPTLATIEDTGSSCWEKRKQGSHGLSCAGIIAAKGWNQKGLRGIAPEAKVKGFNYLCSAENQSSRNLSISWGEKTEGQASEINSEADIYNNSWGADSLDESLSDSLYSTILKKRTKEGRDGKGSLFIKAAGNGRMGFEVDNELTPYALWAQQLGVSFQNTAFEGDNNHIRIFNVAASNASGKFASYSSSGPNILISAPGGEFGEQKPAILTTDSSGCENGYVGGNTESSNPFENKDNPHSENTECNYTSAFNGTSAAAPHLSGVIALILSVRPELNWREVKDILIKTATKIDPNIAEIKSPEKLCSQKNDEGGCDEEKETNIIEGVTVQSSWIENNAGFSFHNSYGFGQVDAKAATELAKTYTLGSLGTLSEEDVASTKVVNSPNDIPKSMDGISSELEISTDMTIEGVHIGLLISHPETGSLHIEVSSPSGTKHIIKTLGQQKGDSDGIGNDEDNGDKTPFEILSNMFYGEKSKGTWKITVRDLEKDESSRGQLQKWSLRFSGRDKVN